MKQIDSLVQSFQQGVGAVEVAGWVNVRRDHGGLIFIDLRDGSGVVQLVFDQKQSDLFQQASQLRAEWVISVRGTLREREAATQNKNARLGHLEVEVQKLRILSKAKTPPIPVSDSHHEVAEEKRLKYRYLDLRRPKLQGNLKLRARFYKFLRDFMEGAGFMEVTTPVLANSSPEGARDFLVPSRLQPGCFYALPQAPQQFKQLLMVGGIHRYYQIATCFRDEDPRADRLYGDFYQLDLEMAFVEKSQIVRQTVQPLVEKLILEFGQLKLHGGRFLELSYQEAMESYGTDKPDLRFELKLQNFNQLFAETKVKVFADVLSGGGLIKGLVTEDVFNKKQLDELTVFCQKKGAGGLAYLTYQAGQWQGPLVKFLSEKELSHLKEAHVKGEAATVFLVADKKEKLVHQVLGFLRNRLADILNLKNPEEVAAAWIIDFPFYEIDEETGQLAFAHNPFSKPQTGLEVADKLQIKADQFDLVLNGYEVCSGAARNCDPALLSQAFELVGYDLPTVKKQFSALLQAFEYGVPPHAGCAFGLDRLLMILAKEDNIRELVAFPKNGSGVDLMMSSPTTINSHQKKELGWPLQKDD